MKRIVALALTLALALCLAVSADAAGSGCALPETLRTVPASAEALSMPDTLPELARVNSFSVLDGLITLELDREVPSLKITELNFVELVESTIFSKKNTAAAETNRTGDDNSIFTVLLRWEEDGAVFEQEYNTWSGDLAFSRAEWIEEADPAAFPSWDSARRVLSFREDGTPESESWYLENEQENFTLTAVYGADGALESTEVSWVSAEYDGDILDAQLSADGVPLNVRCRGGKADFTVRSLPVNAEAQDLRNLMENSYNPAAFSSSLLASYPGLAARLYGLQPSTATDLPATATDVPAADAGGEAGEGEVTENTRIWEVSFGEYFDASVYVFVSDDPLLSVAGGAAALNPEAKDINGAPFAIGDDFTVETPVFEVPAAE